MGLSSCRSSSVGSNFIHWWEDFQTETAHNCQNDKIWSGNVPGTSTIMVHSQNTESVMIWSRICSTGKIPLTFVDQEVNINKKAYQCDILKAVLLPWIHQDFGKSKWIFQQDSAPAHRQKQLNIGAKPIFRISSPPRNGHHILKLKFVIRIIKWNCISEMKFNGVVTFHLVTAKEVSIKAHPFSHWKRAFWNVCGLFIVGAKN